MSIVWSALGILLAVFVIIGIRLAAVWAWRQLAQWIAHGAGALWLRLRGPQTP